MSCSLKYIKTITYETIQDSCDIWTDNSFLTKIDAKKTRLMLKKQKNMRRIVCVVSNETLSRNMWAISIKEESGQQFELLLEVLISSVVVSYDCVYRIWRFSLCKTYWIIIYWNSLTFWYITYLKNQFVCVKSVLQNIFLPIRR